MTPEERQALIDRAMARLAELRQREEAMPAPALEPRPSIVKRGGG